MTEKSKEHWIEELASGRNVKNALAQLEKIAYAGEPELFLFLGLAYQGGDYAELTDHEKAKRYFELGTERGDNILCSYALARIYYFGHGEKKDHKKAAAIVQKIAYDTDYFRAHFMLGYMYENGHGVTKDLDKSEHHLELAFLNGSIPALGNWGRILQKRGKTLQGSYYRVKAFFLGLPYAFSNPPHPRISPL